jgi:hypothetical protein
MSGLDDIRGTQVSTRTAVLVLVVFLALLVAGAALVVRVLTTAPSDSLLVADSNSGAPGTTLAAGRATPRGGAEGERLSSYSVIVERDLFRPSPILLALAASAPRPEAAVEEAAEGENEAESGESNDSGPPNGGPPAQTVFCTGIVTINGERYALLEDTSSGQGRYVAAGGSVFGYEIEEIGDDFVTASKGGEEVTLQLDNAKSANGEAGGGGGEGEGEAAGGPPGNGGNGEPMPGMPDGMGPDQMRVMMEAGRARVRAAGAH